MPLLTVFGWQKPCYLLGEGYAKTFTELMEGTEWEKLRRRQVREMRQLHGALRLRARRRRIAIKHPLKMLPILMRGREDRRSDGAGNRPVKQRPAEFTFSRHVEHKMSEIRAGIPNTTEIEAAE